MPEFEVKIPINNDNIDFNINNDVSNSLSLFQEDIPINTNILEDNNDLSIHDEYANQNTLSRAFKTLRNNKIKIKKKKLKFNKKI